MATGSRLELYDETLNNGPTVNRARQHDGSTERDELGGRGFLTHLPGTDPQGCRDGATYRSDAFFEA